MLQSVFRKTYKDFRKIQNTNEWNPYNMIQYYFCNVDLTLKKKDRERDRQTEGREGEREREPTNQTKTNKQSGILSFQAADV